MRKLLICTLFWLFAPQSPMVAPKVGQQYTRRTKTSYINWIHGILPSKLSSVLCLSDLPKSCLGIFEQDISTECRNENSKNGEGSSEVICSDMDRNKRVYMYRGGTILGFLLCLAGFWNIYSCFLIPTKTPEKINPAVKFVLGLNLIFLAWVVFHASLDMLNFGRIYWEHLL